MEVSPVNEEHAFAGQSCGRPRKVCRPAHFNRIATWNVEGLRGESSVKLEELRAFMLFRGVGILCLQETHLTGASYYKDDGFLFFMSGSTSDTARTFAGVGFIVAPWAASSIISFKAISDRVGSLRVKVTGGILMIHNVYVPHDGHSLEVRQHTFAELSRETKARSEHQTTLVLGDFNAQLGSRKPGEEDCVGPYMFEKQLKPKNVVTNRDLLLEHCTAHRMVIANTFFDNPVDFQVTYYHLAATPSTTVCADLFSQIDHVLRLSEDAPLVSDYWTSRTDVLHSHHFPTILTVDLGFSKQAKQRKGKRLVKDLEDQQTGEMFATEFAANCRTHGADDSIEEHSQVITQAFEAAAAAILPMQTVVARRPWISARTLRMIGERRSARFSGNDETERTLNKSIRQSAADDKRQWLESELEGGRWFAVKRLRRKAATRHANVKDMDGNIVDTLDRPNTLAHYFEKVQWKVTFPTLAPEATTPIRDTLEISIAEFTMAELKAVVTKLRAGRAAGHDDIPSDFYKILSMHEEAMSEVLGLCNHCWRDRDLPESWRVAKVVLLFKKGDTALPENYRAIALLPVGYKILAALIHKRLLDNGVDSHIRASQYGFRPGRSTNEALSVVRRMIDAAHQRRQEGLQLVFLDWAKAFDRIKASALLCALRRFGLPQHFVDMIGAVYRGRSFFIHDHSGDSTTRQQSAGIAQGCPLSPFLFILVQSVMFHDIYRILDLAPEPDFVVTNEALYADDTLLMSSSKDNLQKLLNAVVGEGAKYGLELNWRKTYQMGVSVLPSVSGPNGEVIDHKRSVVYLGGLVTCDGRATAEVIRRVGEGRAAFKQLYQLWSHANISRHRKLEIYESCIVSKILYSLESLWLLQTDRARIDAFHCQCVRRILRIPPSFVSRVSNVDVLVTAGQRTMSATLEARQKSLYQKIQGLPQSNFLKRLVCNDNGEAINWTHKRMRGRPRQMWAQSVQKLLQ